MTILPIIAVLIWTCIVSTLPFLLESNQVEYYSRTWRQLTNFSDSPFTCKKVRRETLTNCQGDTLRASRDILEGICTYRVMPTVMLGDTNRNTLRRLIAFKCCNKCRNLTLFSIKRTKEVQHPH